jgi:hypothetical protein
MMYCWMEHAFPKDMASFYLFDVAKFCSSRVDMGDINRDSSPRDPSGGRPCVDRTSHVLLQLLHCTSAAPMVWRS